MSREMTASPLRRSSSPAAPPLEDEDLLAEILLRLPPLPSSLPRASAVSRRWRSLASDPRFSRRFRAHHRRNPPILGYFVNDYRQIHFQPALEAPNRVPEGRFSFPINSVDRFVPVGCRDGLVLSSASRNKLMVWDPVIGYKHLLEIPPGFGSPGNTAVLRAAGDDGRYFEVVLVGCSNDSRQAFASVYSSKTGLWGNLTTTPLQRRNFNGTPTWVDNEKPAVMIGDSLYWFVIGDSSGFLEFDLGRRSPCMVPMPEEVTAELRDQLLITAEGGGLGLLVLSVFNVQLWNRMPNSDGVTSWVPGRSIALDKLLSLNSKLESPYILGFAEHHNMVILWTSIGTFTVQLESLQFKKLFESNSYDKYFPFKGVYTGDKSIGGGHGGAELRQNA